MSSDIGASRLLGARPALPAIPGERLRPGRVTAAAVGVILALATLSVTLGVARMRDARGNESARFSGVATSVDAAVVTSLRRAVDVSATVGALLAEDPSLSNPQLRAWFERLEVRDRYPGTLAFGFISYVPSGQGERYLRLMRSDPIVPGSPGDVRLRPTTAPGQCLLRLAIPSPVLAALPGPGTDWCALDPTAPGRTLMLYRDRGELGVRALRQRNGRQALALAVPVFRGAGGLPSTRSERRARFIGLVGGIFDLDTILQQATAGAPDSFITLDRSVAAGSGDAGRILGMVTTLATSGEMPGGDVLVRRFVSDSDGRWVVTVAQARSTGLGSPLSQGIAVAVIGVVLSALLVALVVVLVFGRRRALHLVTQRTKELEHLAFHDPLTGLPNRAMISGRLDLMLARATGAGTSVAVLFIDLDDFKTVNDSFGHPVGDQLLSIFAEQVRAIVRQTDTVGRIGGDEFVVLVGDVEQSDPTHVAQRILDQLRVPFQLEGVALPITTSATIGIATSQGGTSDELLRDADTALYEAKAAGRNRFVSFQAGMHNAVYERLERETELRHAIADDQLFLMYQPVFDLATGTVTGFEALARWRHPDRGIMAPGDFIPLAEHTGLIHPLGSWVLRTACAQLTAWHELGHCLSIAVNVSGLQLRDPGFPHELRRTLARHAVDPTRLVIEITETALMHDSGTTAATLVALKELGVRIAIDDFGTGFSSLSYLQRVPADFLKIDRSFVTGITSASNDTKAVLHFLLQLARTLGLTTVAEGIESHAELDHLNRAGCDKGQGFLLARPLDPAMVPAFLDRNATRATA